jgi:polysaccharide export outer membrane protein
MTRTFTNLILICFSLFIFNSCATRENIAYFQDEKISEFNQPIMTYDLIYQPNDMLTIDVSALDPETVQPFNLNTVLYSQSIIDGRSNVRVQTYIIDKNGNIEFPVIGTIKLGGLSRNEATNLLKSEISKYVKDPLVNIRITNFTVSILGEVNNPGTFIIQDEKATLAEVLGLAGDLTIYGKRKNILLVREEAGIKKFSILDLTSVRSLTASTFSLKQNDVLYVEPNNARIRQSSFTQNNAVFISALGTLATIAAIFITR